MIKTLLFLQIGTGVRAISVVFEFVGVVGYVIDTNLLSRPRFRLEIFIIGREILAGGRINGIFV